jgi:NADH:ubiquinone oxidoreductase subunit F (NADH-binding)/NAD-dependent dihydropyrimidine dehydrogenase PreA subunit/(2Fe-2S) ferredoxin
MKVRSRADLARLAASGRAACRPPRPRIAVGMATCGLATGAADVYAALHAEAEACGLDLDLVATGCLGYCQQEPLVDVRLPDGRRVLYARVTARRARDLISALNEGLLPAEGALAAIPDEISQGPQLAGEQARTTLALPLPDLPLLQDLPFYARQQKVILRNSGLLDPLSAEEYAARGGFVGLARALELTPQAVVDEIVRSGLRGRGGGGFPTGCKWQVCRDAPGGTKYIVCNGDEGDPGAYMDRTVLESDPFGVLEGMAIGAYAVGAHQGILYVRDEYPLAVERVAQAKARAEELGLLGQNILGSGFDFTVHVVRGAGAFVCGEETALLASIEGGLGEPRPKPPYPATSGLWGKPTVINNVKTWASVSAILARGADWYASLGVKDNRGTVVFSLVGKVANTGLVEVPLGLTLRDLVEGIGGGGLDGRPVKAVQTGGPSGGCLPARLFHLPIDYETLTAAGSIMGSGGMVVLDEATCMVDVARYFLAFTMDESCGKCTPCREGTRAMYDILTRLVEGQGRAGDLELLEEIGRWVKGASLCGLGGTAPNPVLSTLRYFRDEYEAHLAEGRCPAGTCRALIRLTILAELCTGCGLCLRECPAGAIHGEKGEPHTIDVTLCTHCRICYDLCPVSAIEIGC